MRKLLIATTNEGKFAEISQFLETLPFEIVSLKDIKKPIKPPEESEGTLEKNALLKAKYYAEKTALLTIAGDKALCLFDPAELTSYVATEEGVGNHGKALLRIKYHLQNTYGAKNIVVPCAMIIKNGNILMQLRNDPHRPDFHKKWEFPGGGVEFGESIHANLKREVKEETGYKIEIIKLLQYIEVEAQEYPTWKYQVFLLPYVCKIAGGRERLRDDEVIELRWFDLNEVLEYDLIGENHRMYRKYLPELKQIINEYEL